MLFVLHISDRNKLLHSEIFKIYFIKTVYNNKFVWLFYGKRVPDLDSRKCFWVHLL